jgi:hypothetical protein
MKFGVVDPRCIRAEVIDAPNWTDAAKQAGLESGHIDHGMLRRDGDGGIAYFCCQFAMFMPVSKQRYFSVGRRLIAGSALIYAFNEAGEERDLVKMPPIIFYRDAAQVEKAIAARNIDRPTMTIDGMQIWAWPQWPDDANIVKRMRQHGEL